MLQYIAREIRTSAHRARLRKSTTATVARPTCLRFRQISCYFRVRPLLNRYISRPVFYNLILFVSIKFDVTLQDPASKPAHLCMIPVNAISQVRTGLTALDIDPFCFIYFTLCVKRMITKWSNINFIPERLLHVP